MPPLAPIAPTSLPSLTIGKPPSDATAPPRGNMLSVAGDGAPLAPLITSANTLLGLRNNAAARALACEIGIDAYCVPSIVACAIRLPAGSTTVIDIFQLCFFASVIAATIALLASSRLSGAP